ncbi:MAG: response regulator transcription factor [Candidatus Omnitrophota bacterium]
MKFESEAPIAECEMAETPQTSLHGTARRRIFILDDHPMVREGIRKLIEEHPDLMVCGEAVSSREASEAVDRCCPDLVIVDLSLRDSIGLDFIKTTRARYPKIAILVLSMHEDPVIVERALKIGALGYVSKSEGLTTLFEGIYEVLGGRHYLSPIVKKKLVDNEFTSDESKGPSMAMLSDRELEVFQILAAGQPISKIAGLLHLSVKTVEGYCAHIRKKLGLTNNQALILEACRRFPGY